MQAVCCDDHEHCCPNGYTCDVPEQKCNKANGESISWAGKVEATPIERVTSLKYLLVEIDNCFVWVTLLCPVLNFAKLLYGTGLMAKYQNLHV